MKFRLLAHKTQHSDAITYEQILSCVGVLNMHYQVQDNLLHASVAVDRLSPPAVASNIDLRNSLHDSDEFRMACNSYVQFAMDADEPDKKFMWDHESTRDFIELYKKHPVLYATKNGNYKNKLKRLEALKAIRYEMMKKGRRMCIDDIKKKIHVLRTQYAYQLSKIKNSQKNCQKPEDVYRPRLWCFSQLEFLQNADSAVVDHDNQEEEIQETKDLGQLDILGHDEDTHEMGSFYDEIGLGKHENTTPTPSETPIFISAGVGKNKSVEDDLSTFAKLVEFELRKINNRQLLRKLKRDILGVLLDAQEACDN